LKNTLKRSIITMKSKYKLKSKSKYAEGTSGIAPYQQGQYIDDPAEVKRLNNASATAQGVNQGISTVASAIPIANIFAGIGKAGRSAVRQDDAYNVAKSDGQAAVAATFSPSKSTIHNLEEGRIGDAALSLLLPFGSAARDNKRNRAERDEMIRNAQAINNTKAFQGSDETLSQSGQIYKTGTNGVKASKPVEAEGGELIFKKIGNRYKLKADLNGPSHKNGGVDIRVESKDVIVPKKDASKVKKMIGKNGLTDSKFESYRVKLPKDQPVAAKGSEYLDPKGLGGVSPQYNINPQYTAPALPQDQVETGGSNFMANAGGYLNTAAQLAPTLYNIGQGLFGKVEKEKANFVNPELYKYQDSSDPMRRASETAYRIDTANSRNLSGGNAGNIRANLNQANVANFNRKQDINSAEVDRSLQTANMNTNLKNQYKLINSQEQARVNAVNAVRAGKKSEYLGKGLEGLSNYSMNKENVTKADNEQLAQNDILADSVETRNYKYSKLKRKSQYKTK
jgi:hypothetical protein